MASWWNSPGALFLRSAFWTVLAPGIMAGYLPWRFFGVRWPASANARTVIAVLLGAMGAIVLLASIIEFARRGRGTLSPVDPPRRLVVTGWYRWVRNPMYVGVLLLLFGEILIAPSWGFALYIAALFAAVNVFIRGYEEPYLQRRFGASYEEYRRHVRRWIPRVRPWRVRP